MTHGGQGNLNGTKLSRLSNSQKITACLVLIAFIGLMVILTRAQRDPLSSATEKFQFLGKRLLVEDPDDIIINFTDLRGKLQSYVAASPERIGVYFEYLWTGVSINVNATDDFFRASLVKLPVVMRIYRLIEDGRLAFDDVLTVEAKQLDSGFGDLWRRGAGVQLTVRELIRLVLIESDNTAFNVLYERVNVALLKDAPDGNQAADDVYDYLDIPRQAEGTTPLITPKNFSSILRSLYFSAYLSYQHSNDILQTMTEPHATGWLRAGVRPGIPVANKIGVHDDATQPDLLVYSDCGIVYYPKRPYMLCIMVNSPNEDASIAHIQTISKYVFEAIDRR